MSISEHEIRRKMQDLIRKKHLRKGEDSLLTLDDGTELNVCYEEDT